MPRKGDVQFIPTSTPGSAPTLPLNAIPQEVKDEVEEIYEALKTNPGRMRVEFDTANELAAYALQISSYCAQRPAGAIRYRKSPTKGLPPTVLDFRITDLKTENEEITETIREATEAANAAAVEPEVSKATRKR
jgi:hypothetical protein